MSRMDTSDQHIALGTMYFGSRVDSRTSFALLDRFIDRGGSWLDTANNYAFWVDASGVGGASENAIGTWLRGNNAVRGEVKVSTKLGADPTIPGQWPESMEGLSRDAITSAFERSMARLGVDRVDLLWAHVEDRSVDLATQVESLGSLVADGRVGRLGASNHAIWRVDRARRIAWDRNVEPFSALQLRHTFLKPTPFMALPDGGHVVATPEALDYVRAEDLEMWTYNTLLSGAYASPDRLQSAYDHPDTRSRLETLDRVAARHGASRNQIVLAWLLGSSQRFIPIVGVSTISQLDEVMDARNLRLDAASRAELEGGGER